jgi:hypothetical protein
MRESDTYLATLDKARNEGERLAASRFLLFVWHPS